MCVLVISYKPEADEVCRGCVVGHYYGDIQVKWCEHGEDAIQHVAHLNAWNEPGAEEYQHFFVYPDSECPYVEKNVDTGEIVYQPHCIPMSQVDLNIEDEYGGVPEHLRGPIEAQEQLYRARAQQARKEQQEAEERRRKDEQRRHDEQQFEHLKRKLGK